MKHNPLTWMCLTGMSSLLVACGGDAGEDGLDRSAGSATTVSLQYDVAALLQQNLNAGSVSAANFTSDQILRGQLAATTVGGINDGQEEIFNWTIYLDEDTFAASSNSTLTLAPGNYEFELLMGQDDQQYAGFTATTIADGENDISMIIKPVIGDAVSDVTIIDRLAYFKFQYQLADLAAIAAPAVGISVDAGAEQVFAINTQTGMSDTFVNLPAGQHTLDLAFYDGAVQVGKSIAAQEVQNVNYGVNLAMDIVPLYGEVAFSLTETGADTTVTINVPAEVIDEVGGVNNLTSTLSLVSPKNPLQETTPFYIQQGDGSYQASVVLTDLQYDDVVVSLTYGDATTGDQVASCSQAWTLTTQSPVFTCDVTLIRRAVINSSILGVLAVNVEDDAGVPVSGAVITNAAGDTLGVTGGGAFGSQGYVKLYLGAGSHDLTATDPLTGDLKSATVTVLPLSVGNLSMVLAAPVPVGFAGAFADSNWTLSSVGPSVGYGMNASAFNISVGNGGGGATAEITIPQNGTISFDWVINVYSAGQNGDAIRYLINGVQYDLSTYGTNSGSASGIAVSAGDTFMLSTWGSTQSSNYTASFTNFNFTTN